VGTSKRFVYDMAVPPLFLDLTLRHAYGDGLVLLVSFAAALP